VKRSSPLETLKDLRERAREGERARLAARLQAEKQAELAERQARELLLARSSEREATRRSEQERLASQGITAAEGQRQLAWELAERRRLEQLSGDVERALAERRAAQRDQEQARRALERAHAELQVVEQRIAQQQRQAQQRAEQAQQEALDDAVARRFAERSDA
jgi:hypothetical protein